MAYVSPSAAFSGTLEDALIRRDAKRRQDMLDQHQIKMDEANLEFRKEDLAARREDRHAAEMDRHANIVEKAKDAEANQYAKQVAGKQPGDVFTPDMAKRAIETGNSDDFAPQEPQRFTDETGAVTQGTTPLAGVMQSEPTAQDLVANKIPVRFMGSPAQRQADVKKRETETYIASLPDGPLKDAATFRLRTGGQEPAAILKPPAEETQDVVFVSQDRKSFSRMEPGKGLVPTTGPFKKGTHFVEAPQPPQGPQPIVIQTAEGPMAWSHGGAATPITGPGGAPIEAPLTATTRTMMDGAKMLQPHVGRVDQLAQELDKRGLFGPVASRMRDALAKVGTIDATDFDKSSDRLQAFSSAFNAEVDADPKLSSDALVGQFASEVGLLASGAGRVHGGARGGGSIQMIDYMKNMLSTSGSYQMFHGRLSGLDSYIRDYAKGPGSHAGGPATPQKTKVFTAGPYKGKTGVLQPDGSYEVQ